MAGGPTPELDLRALRDDAAALLESRVRQGAAPGSKAYRQYQLDVDAYVKDATGGRFANFAALQRAVAAPTVRGMGRALARGVTFNFDDELARALGVGQQPGGMYSPEGQAEFAQFRQQHPGAAAIGEMLGGVVLPVGGLARGATVLGSIGRGAALGAVSGGLAGAGDAAPGERLERAMVPAALGAGLGAAVPAGVAGARALGRVRDAGGISEFAARFKTARAVADAGTLGPAGMPVVGAPAARAPLAARVAAGNRRLADIARDFELADRGQQVIVADLNPEIQANLVNAVRGNPTLAASEPVQQIIGRQADAPMRAVRDVQAAMAAQGRSTTLPSLAQAQQGRTAALQGAVRENFGPLPAVPGPAAIGQQVPSQVGISAGGRIAEITDNLAAWADGPTGYGGLRDVARQGVARMPQQMTPILNRLNMLIQRNPSRPTSRVLSEVAEGVNLLRTGDARRGRVGVDEVRDRLATINDLLDRGFMLDEGGQRIRLTSEEIDVLKTARSEITRTMDSRILQLQRAQGLRPTSATPFSDVAREYATRSARARAVQAGRDLANGQVFDVRGVRVQNPTLDDYRLAWRKIDPAMHDEARVAMASELIARLGGTVDPNTGGNLVKKLVEQADRTYTDQWAFAFPNRQAFRRFVFQAQAMKAMDEGAAFIARHTPDELQQFVNQLALSARKPPAPGQVIGPVDKQARDVLLRNFRDGMLSRFLDDLAEPAGVARVAEMVAGSSPDQIAKLRVMLGNRGVRVLRERLGSAENAMARTSGFLADAARNPAARDFGLPSQVVARNNPVTTVGNVMGVARRVAAPILGRRYQAEMLRLGAMGASPQSFNQFANTMAQAVAPIQPGGPLSVLLPAAAVRGVPGLLSTPEGP